MPNQTCNLDIAYHIEDLLPLGCGKWAERMTEPTIVHRVDQPCVFIPISVSPREWGRANALVEKLFDWLARHEISLSGLPFFRYLTIGDTERPFDLQVGVLTGDDRVIPGVVPGGLYAVTVHTGHPDRLLASFNALDRWIAERKLAPAIRRDGADEVWEGRYEFYLTDPTEQPNLHQWSIEIAYLLDGENENPLNARSSDRITTRSNLPARSSCL